MASGSWLLTTGGAWNNNANWSAAFPNALTDTATIATNLTQDETITLGQAISVGSMTFSDNGASGNAWTIAPGGAFALTLGTSTITTTTNVTISAAVAGSAAVTKAGAGTLTLSGGGTNTGAWNINSGAINITTTNFSSTTGLVTVTNAALNVSANFNKPWVIAAGGSAKFTSGTSSISEALLNGSLTAGAIAVIDGGTVTASSRIMLGNTTNTYGSIWLKSGNLNHTGDVASTQGLDIGDTATGSGYLRISGGTASINASYLPASGVGVTDILSGSATFINLWPAYFQSSKGAVHVLSGSHNFTSAGFSKYTVNATGSSTRYGAFVISNATLTGASGSAFTFNQRSDDLGTYTLVVKNSGTLTSRVTCSSTTATNPQVVFLDNSTLSVNSGTGVFLGGGVLQAYIGAGGATFNVGASISALNANISAPLTPTTGNGIASIPLATAGSGYRGAPLVIIARGAGDTTGAGAIARANVDLDSTSPTYGQVTDIEVLNPGVAYTATPIVTLTSGGCATAATINSAGITFVANTATGGITKTGLGTATLTGTNTYTGDTVISQGILRVGYASATGTLGNNDSSNVTVAANAVLAFGRSDTRTYSNIISGNGTIQVEGGPGSGGEGRAILSGSNTFTSSNSAIQIINNNSVLRVTNNSAIGTGTSFGIVINTGTAFELDGSSGSLTSLPAKALTLGSTGTGFASAGGIRNIAGNNSYAGTITLAAASRINSDAGTLSLTAAGAITGGSNALTFGGASSIVVNQAINTTGNVIKDGAGFTSLAATSSTYTGKTTVSAGTLGYATIAAAGSVSSFGSSSGANSTVDIAAGAGIRFTGSTPQSFTRTINSTANAAGAVLRVESDGSAAVTHSSVFTNTTSNQTRTYQLGGGGTANNTVSFVIADNGMGAVSVTKADSGKWLLSGANTYTGNTTVSAGTLVASSETGAARFGASNTVTVANGAKIQTLKGTNQNGRHTYNNLTFSAGGRIRIGG